MIINLKDHNLPLLLSDIQVPLYHSNYELRHPWGIYNLSFSTVIKNFSKTINLLLRVIYERPFLAKTTKEGDRSLVFLLLESQKDLLYALMEHLDDCDNILACFFSTRAARNKNSYVKDYRNSTSEYRTHIGKLVNFLKHNQGRLRDVTFYNDKLVLPGYFIVGGTGDDGLGPAKSIHSGNTAFSFARDLRYNFFHFYAVAQHLNVSISKITGKEIDSSINKKPSEEIINIASSISNLPSFFYEDELLKPIPNIKVSQNSNLSDKVVTLIYPDNSMRIDTTLKGMIGVVTHIGDGMTRSFGIPYMKSK